MWHAPPQHHQPKFNMQGEAKGTAVFRLPVKNLGTDPGVDLLCRAKPSCLWSPVPTAKLLSIHLEPGGPWGCGVQDQRWHSSSSLAPKAGQLLCCSHNTNANAEPSAVGVAHGEPCWGMTGPRGATGHQSPRPHGEAASQLQGATREPLVAKFLPNFSPESLSAARRASNSNRSGITWRGKHDGLSSNCCNNALYREL